MKFLILPTVLIFSLSALAEGKWSHESEASVVTISGNSESQTTSAKQKTKYAREKDSATVTASYTEAEAEDTATKVSETSAKSSSIGIRYDHIIDGKLSGFVGHAARSDRFSGITQEDKTDIGLSYQISKRDDQEWSLELGYQLSTINYVAEEDDTLNILRLQTEYSKKINESVSAGLLVEYKDAFEEAQNSVTLAKDKQYWVSSQANLKVVMSSILSLKLAYENKYANFRPAGTEERVDSIFTTALVAKF